jgi:hypothetical protein
MLHALIIGVSFYHLFRVSIVKWLVAEDVNYVTSTYRKNLCLFGNGSAFLQIKPTKDFM